jgi:hypothetical protein
MPNRRTERYYYRNSQIRRESKEVDGKFHGLCRSWHPNGELAEASHYRHGLLHGTTRQWDKNGRLLGSFSMDHGTGRQLYFHQNGQLNLEINSLNGKFLGRTRFWLRDGTLIRETYCIDNVNVSRAKYLNAAREHSNWPQHEGESAGKVARDNQALKRKEHELFIESLLESNFADAQHWLSAAAPDLRSLARFRSAKAAIQFLEALSEAGAESVIAALIYPGKRGKEFSDRLLIKLPKALVKRRKLRIICQALCNKRGGAMLPDKEMGESHLFINLE